MSIVLQCQYTYMYVWQDMCEGGYYMLVQMVWYDDAGMV